LAVQENSIGCGAFGRCIHEEREETLGFLFVPFVSFVDEKNIGSLGVAVILDISGHAPCDFAAK
jgi:hypothetical protein